MNAKYITSYYQIVCLVIFGVVLSPVLSADESPKKVPDMNAWRKKLPDEVAKKLGHDMSALLQDLGYNSRPGDKAAHSRPSMNVWGNDSNNFDKDNSKDWVIHVVTKDFRGKLLEATLIYDKTEHGWTCIAKLPGRFPITWGKAFEGRRGIRTIKRMPEDSPSTEQHRYYRWDGTRYIPDRIEFVRGG